MTAHPEPLAGPDLSADGLVFTALADGTMVLGHVNGEPVLIARRWDHADVAGSVADRACSVAFRKGGKTLAVASVKRDLENLKAEVALEANDEAALARLVAT